MGQPMIRIDTKLYEWCTVRQLEVLQAVEKHKSMRAAARALGINYSGVSETLTSVTKKAAVHGYSPRHDLTHAVAPGQILRGASTLYRRGEPEPVLQWVKSRADDDAREAIIRASVKALSESCKGLAPLVIAPKHTDDELLAVYPMGDPHFGMLAWAKETGEAFDSDIARSLTLGAVDRLVGSAPAASTAIVLPLGDVFHANDQSNVTPTHKYQLDVDSRHVKVLQIGIHTFRHVILRALERHARVVVRFVAGNHDPNAVWALAFSIAAFFDSEPRVEVDLSPSLFWYYRHGATLIGATHGDKAKHEVLPGVMANDRAKDWGETRYRYWLTGHVHHQSVREFPGVTCESFRTLAAMDAHASGLGYRAGRDMRCIVYSRQHGEVERHRCDVGMLPTG